MGRVFGEIEGVAVGATFADREALHRAGVHRPLQAGISGAAADGADSIVLNEGYEDDIDRGDEIIYTGHGGRDPSTGRQLADQKLTLGNRALAHSMLEGLPVRVIRGPKLKSAFAPPSGYRYDGLYLVDDYWTTTGKSGFQIIQFRLTRYAEDRSAWPQPTAPTAEELKTPSRRSTTVQRIIRSTATANRVKLLHNHACQVCGVRLETPAGPYAEGAHIMPLGMPHSGPDTASNILCLCPNHHVLFDDGAVGVNDDFTLIGVPGRLRTVRRHPVAAEVLRHHRERHGLASKDLP